MEEGGVSRLFYIAGQGLSEHQVKSLGFRGK